MRMERRKKKRKRERLLVDIPAPLGISCRMLKMGKLDILLGKVLYGLGTPSGTHTSISLTCP
jgi:hypothetical protein